MKDQDISPGIDFAVVETEYIQVRHSCHQKGFAMILHVLALMLSLATNLDGSPASDQQGAAVGRTKSVSAAIAEFNSSNEDTANWAGQSPLTEQELIAALVHEKKTLSADAQKAAEEIIESRTLPSAVQLKAYQRHFADRHATYLYQIKLSFDRGPVRDELGEIVEGRRRVESVIVRKHYLATQKKKARQELKSLPELLAESGS